MDRTIRTVCPGIRPFLEDDPGLVHGPQGLRDAGLPSIRRADHKRAVAESRDVPEEAPRVPIHLGEVGISRKTVWIDLPEGRIPFDAEVFVDLPADCRGIHMSRIEEAVYQLHSVTFTDPGAYAVELARHVSMTQRGDKVRVRIAGKMPVLRRTTVSGRASVDTVRVHASCSLTVTEKGRSEDTRIGLAVHHITACPCTQAYAQAICEGMNGTLPLPTHSQRSETMLEMGRSGDRPTYEDLLRCLETALHVTQDLLKRPDEAEIVMKSHRSPQFAEDAVREVAREVGLQLGDRLAGAIPVIIESTSLESIHIHDVRCRLETTLARILAAISAQSDREACQIPR